MSNYLIRKALIEDVEEIFKLEQDYPSDSYSKQTIINSLNDERTITLLIYDNKECVGYVSFNYIFDESSIIKIVVLSSRRRNGIGGKLLLHAITLMRSLGVKQINLEVRNDNMPAKALYESVGFKKIHQRQKYYSDGMSADIYLLCL